METIMRLALLTGIAAVSLLGVAAAKAETIYVTEPDVVAATPGYVYSAPAPFIAPAPFGYRAPRYVVTEPAAPVVIAEPPPSYVVVAPQVPVVNPPLVVAPRTATAPVVVPRSSGIVTTGFSTERRCFIDLNGFERCY
jgi:hypothetical protein